MMMCAFRAAFGRAVISPDRLGHRLMGYGNRSQGAIGIHDHLQARALVIEDQGASYVVVASELRCLDADSVREIREAVQQRTGIDPGNVFVTATHTHSGPHDRDAENWERPLAEILADAVEAAQAALQPAKIGSGYGMLYGYSINRRWIERPVDPAVAVIRIDDESGRPLGLVTNFGCHPVVLGPDNLLISGDWPGYACRMLEEQLGNGATCLFLQGGAGEVNPLVQGVREALHSGRRVVSIGNISTYYGDDQAAEPYNIGDRTGGTFVEVAELGEAFVHEVLHVATSLQPAPPSTPTWTERVIVDALGSSKPASAPSPAEAVSQAQIPAEIMLIGIGNILLLGQPGEVFSQTSVTLKRRLRALGYSVPMVVGHANGWLSYLPEPEAFDEGGYEPWRANQLGISPDFQARVWRALEPIVQQRARALPAH